MTTAGGAPAGSAEAELDTDVERVGASLRISWTVTNRGTADLLMFDDRRPDEPGDTERYGAYVTGRDDGTVEIARRLFPVPEDLEGFRPYGVSAGTVAPGTQAQGREIVLLPLTHVPAAPEGGGQPLPANPTQAVFCIGVGPAGELPAASQSSLPEGFWFVNHSPANVAAQTLLCSDPFDLTPPA